MIAAARALDDLSCRELQRKRNPSMNRNFNVARRVFAASRGVCDAIGSAGLQAGISHSPADFDLCLDVAGAFLDKVTEVWTLGTEWRGRDAKWKTLTVNCLAPIAAP